MAEQKATLGMDARTKMTSDKEVELIKKVFKGNDHLLTQVRNLFYGLPVSDEDRKIIKKVFSNADFKNVLRKKMFPIFELDMMDVPVNSIADFWYGTEQNIFGQSRDAIYQNVYSKIQVRELLDQAFRLLSDPFSEKAIDLSFTPSMSDDLQVRLLARNLYIRTVVEGLNFIRIVCEREDPKPIEVKKRREKDSVE